MKVLFKHYPQSKIRKVRGYGLNTNEIIMIKQIAMREEPAPMFFYDEAQDKFIHFPSGLITHIKFYYTAKKKCRKVYFKIIEI